MKHQTFELPTPGGPALFARTWEPDTPPAAYVCLVHGLGEHSGRYEPLAQFLTGQQYAVTSFDLRGHGQSPGKRGHVPSYDTLMDDIHTALDQAASRWPDLPGFLYGHSLGGNLVLNYALRRQPDLAGVISTSPWLRLAFEPPAWKLTVGKLLYILWPSVTLPNGLNTRDLCRDPEVVRAYEQDPLVHNKISAQLGINLLQSARWALNHAAEMRLPLLLVHGSADRITSPAASAEFAAASGPETTYKAWESCYHEVHNDPQRPHFYASLLVWLEARREKARTVQEHAA